MPGTRVCESRSVRRCVCPACRPYHGVKEGKSCKCELVADKKSLIEGIESESDKRQREESDVPLIRKCECKGCRPSDRANHRRVCLCTTARLIPATPKQCLPPKEKRQKKYRRDTVTKENLKLSCLDQISAHRASLITFKDEEHVITTAQRHKSAPKIVQIDKVKNNYTNIKHTMSNAVIVTPRRRQLPKTCSHFDKEDTNIRFYSKHLSPYEISRIAFAVHRLLHNYVMFRSEESELFDGILNEDFMENMSIGINKFFSLAYLYDHWYQPISIKNQFGYLEMHVKVGLDDRLLKECCKRIFMKVFLVIFHRGEARFVLTKQREPVKMNEKQYEEAIKRNCKDVWCRVNIVSACVNPVHRVVDPKEVNQLYKVLTDETHAISKRAKNIKDLWTCIDFDTGTDEWSSLESSQFVSVMRKETDPYKPKNLLDVAEQEKKLTPESKRKRLIS